MHQVIQPHAQRFHLQQDQKAKMNCSCIRGEGNFQFEIKAISPSFLIYTDLSDWMEHPNYKDPSSYTLKVQPPYGDEVQIDIDVNKANRITALNLFKKEIEIPDGIYCFTLENCGYTYMKYKAICRRLECCADKLYIEGKDTTELDDLIRGIKVSTEFQNISTAQDLYKQAEIILKNNQCYC